MDYRETDNNKEVGHLAHRHRIGTITHDRENTEQADTDTHRRLTTQLVKSEYHEEHQEEYGYARQQKREVIVSALTLPVIQSVNDKPIEKGTDDKPHHHLHKVTGERKNTEYIHCLLF
jgi:hypothetical protein